MTLLKNLELILIIPVVSWYIAQVLSPMFKINIKPFACSKCMGLWLGLTAFVYYDNQYYSIPLAIVTSTLSIIFERWMSKL